MILIWLLSYFFGRLCAPGFEMSIGACLYQCPVGKIEADFEKATYTQILVFIKTFSFQVTWRIKNKNWISYKNVWKIWLPRKIKQSNRVMQWQESKDFSMIVFLKVVDSRIWKRCLKKLYWNRRNPNLMLKNTKWCQNLNLGNFLIYPFFVARQILEKVS